MGSDFKDILNRKQKGLSPLIASVLLIGFTMAVAAILVVWITGFTQQQTTTVGQRADLQTKCSYSSFTVPRNDVAVVANTLNVTVIYSAGSEVLNITGFEVRDTNGISYVNITIVNGSAVQNLAVGSVTKFSNYILSGSLPGGVSWSRVRVTALCQNQYTVVGSISSA
ncbi:MAG: hypothetical protein HYT71_01620 [Candidatus Aenigmarchaeota archaeon]|nr:hypothetical protein [Candidatus Aenigmarchaeota archaeon]